MRYSIITFFLLAVGFNSFGQRSPNIYILVHGAWSNSTVFKSVDSVLTKQGSTVYRPTLTGLGERRHLSNPTINLSTHIADIVNVIQTENLYNIILVGHSYAGMVISGVADQLPDRIKQLVYIDAFVPNSGESLLTTDNISLASKESLLASIEGDFIKMPVASIKTVERQPTKTFTEKLVLKNVRADLIPTVYVLMVPANTDTKQADFYKASIRAKQRGWLVRPETGYHADLMTRPEYLANLLQRVIIDK